jgi:hypothetical protein
MGATICDGAAGRRRCRVRTFRHDRYERFSMKFIELGLNCLHLFTGNESTYARFESRFCGVE